jgi:hypothetical protein
MVVPAFKPVLECENGTSIAKLLPSIAYIETVLFELFVTYIFFPSAETTIDNGSNVAFLGVDRGVITPVEVLREYIETDLSLPFITKTVLSSVETTTLFGL